MGLTPHACRQLVKFRTVKVIITVTDFHLTTQRGPQTPAQALRQLDFGSSFITGLVTPKYKLQFVVTSFAGVCCPYTVDFSALCQIPLKDNTHTHTHCWKVNLLKNCWRGEPSSSILCLLMRNAFFPQHLSSISTRCPPLSATFSCPFTSAVACTKTDFQSVNHHVLPSDGRISFAEHRGPISRVIPGV